jgi:hypothetical protein
MRRGVIRSSERGSALLIITFVLIVVLAGGLAGIAVTNGELAGARGTRIRTTTDACADAAVERLRAMLPNVPTFDATAGTMSIGSQSLPYRAGHVDGDGTEATIVEVSPSSFDMGSLYKGLNITNTMGTVMGGNLAEGLRILRLTAVCGDDNVYGKREVEVLLRYGTPTN